MSSTRFSQQPLQIYQDPATSFDHAPMPSNQNPSNPKKSSPLRPIKNAASRKNIILDPPRNGAVKQSPLKSAQQSSSSPSRAPFGNKLNMVSMPPPGGPVYNTDSIEKKQPLMSKFKPQKALFTTFTSATNMDKENYQDASYHQPPPSSYANSFVNGNFSLEGLYSQRPIQRKRTLLEAAPIHESRPLKKIKTEDASEGDDGQDRDLPASDSFPPIVDDGSKPSHSYAQLIGMSIFRAPNRRLTLAQIYKWISDTYSFYNATDAGWQNSIRHNLSLNKAFIKQERPRDDPGKGNYWAIQPGMEHQFIKDKLAKKSIGLHENSIMLPANLAPINQQDTAQFTPLIPAPPELPPQPTYSLPEPQQLPPIPELSSDATIPASDAFNQEPEQEELDEPPPSSPLIQSSPPAPLMHSSPPVPLHVPRRNDTPPPVPRFHSSSRSRSHKRKFASMDDSGYISSLSSSAMRPHGVGRLLTSGADRPRIKRGRAEEEIARLRGSSYDSPTKPRLISSFAPPSSSPLRHAQKHKPTQMLPPLTPIVKLKPRVRPPPTASPNTNLQLHRDKVRELVGSPARGMTVLDENTPWSPAFDLAALEENSYLFPDFSADFDIFADVNAGLLSVPGDGSPEKRSAKRPRLDRSKSANVLANIPNNSFIKSPISTPMLKFTPSLEPGIYSSSMKDPGLTGSPGKLLGIGSPSKMPSPSFSINFDLPIDEEFYGAEFLAEDITDFGGMDIMQGFRKIGSGTQSSRSTPKANNSRPSFGRSLSTRF